MICKPESPPRDIFFFSCASNMLPTLPGNRGERCAASTAVPWPRCRAGGFTFSLRWLLCGPTAFLAVGVPICHVGIMHGGPSKLDKLASF
jgi:hypothetical protein